MAGRELSEEAKALSALRKQKRAEKAAITALTASPSIANSKGNILKRDWVSLRSAGASTPTVKIMTWNMLAQTLVRRDLFPNSDCLRSGQREDMLTREVLTYDPDIACLQEVDRLEKHLPVFTSAGYVHVYASGPGKRHGCLILYKGEIFEKVAEKTVFYDDTDLNQFLGSRPLRTADQPTISLRIGSSIRTKNIASIVALARKDGHSGCLVATTHAFWHPKYKYERARQGGILVRSAQDVRDSDVLFRSWPIYIAGDLNSQPSEATYALLTGNPLLPHHLSSLQDSRVIHLSLDPSVAITHPSTSPREDEDEGAPATSNAEGDGLENHPDRIITNARSARPEDGLLSDDELLQLYRGGSEAAFKARSAYDEALAAVPEEGDNVYGSREPSAVYGRNEPMYTSFTHYWQLTLDYILIVDPVELGDHPRDDVRVVGVLKPHRKKDLGDGLPKQSVCGSDHIALMIEVSSA